MTVSNLKKISRNIKELPPLDFIDLRGLAISNPVSGQILRYTNGEWTNQTPSFTISQITNLQANLDSKQVTGDYATNIALSAAISGTAPTIHTHSMAYLTDFNITSPVSGEILKYSDGKWTNSRTILNDNLDVNIPSLPIDGDIFSYVASSGMWTNKNFAASHTHPLSGLSDTEIVSPSEDQFLQYINGKWKNGVPTISLSGSIDMNISNPTSGQMLRYYNGLWSNTNFFINLADDVNVSGLNLGDILSWNSITSKWENVSLSSISVPLSAFPDVNISNPKNDQILTYVASSGKWTNTYVYPITLSLGGTYSSYQSSGSVEVLSYYDGANPVRVYAPEFPTIGTKITLIDSTSTASGSEAAQFVGYNGGNVTIDGVSVSADSLTLNSTYEYIYVDALVGWKSYKSDAQGSSQFVPTPTVSLSGTNNTYQASGSVNVLAYYDGINTITVYAPENPEIGDTITIIDYLYSSTGGIGDILLQGFEASNIDIDGFNTFGETIIKGTTNSYIYIGEYGWRGFRRGLNGGHIITTATTAAPNRTNLKFDTIGNLSVSLSDDDLYDQTTVTLSAGDSTVAVSATSVSATFYPVFTSESSGSMAVAAINTSKLYFNPGTGEFSATSFNALSDQTLKENITNIDNATGIIEQLTGVEFNWSDTGQKSAGIIAQELEKILPHLVATNDVGIKSVNYSGIIAYLIETVKELNDRISSLENK